eukprot:347792-Chlamydomonas_euryale.AAC.2
MHRAQLRMILDVAGQDTKHGCRYDMRCSAQLLQVERAVEAVDYGGRGEHAMLNPRGRETDV